MNALPDIPHMRYYLYNFDKNENANVPPKLRRRILFYRRFMNSAVQFSMEERISTDSLLEFIETSAER